MDERIEVTPGRWAVALPARLDLDEAGPAGLLGCGRARAREQGWCAGLVPRPAGKAGDPATSHITDMCRTPPRLAETGIPLAPRRYASLAVLGRSTSVVSAVAGHGYCLLDDDA